MKNDYNDYTKKQLINKIKINSVRHLFINPSIIKKKDFKMLLKERLITLLIIQELLLEILDKKLPKDCQLNIMSFL
jgi:hypothetical protein